MIDRERVIIGLESLKKRLYNDKNILDGGIVGNALALLKSQEPVKPNEIRHGNMLNMLMYYQCPSCMSALSAIDKYCSQCGRKVKWE